MMVFHKRETRDDNFLPIELIDVLNVSKQVRHLLRSDGQVTNVNDMGQVVLQHKQGHGVRLFQF